MPDELVELIAQRLRVLGEPTRIRLLDRLREGEQTVNELAAALDAGQQNVSKHLVVLAGAGVVARRKDRNHVYYRIADESALRLCEQVCGTLSDQFATMTAVVDAGRTRRDR